jgi:AraC-like DNA-binding protein/mannose-6-phosphate isomerase-like protein (cupin superfamily)
MPINDINLNQGTAQIQNESINKKNLYINHTADYKAISKSFIHNSIEILLVEQGTANYEIQGHSYHVHPHDILIIGAMNVHVSNILQTPYIRYGIYLNPTFLESISEILKDISIYSSPSPALFNDLKQIPEDTFNEIIHIAKEIYMDTNQYTPENSELIKPLLWELTVRLKRLLKNNIPRIHDIGSARTMFAVKNYIDQNYMKECTLADVCKKYFLSEATISRGFKEIFNVNFNQYLTRTRITNSVKLLENTTESITTIAMNVGYQNVNSYIRAFSKIMQISPFQYRKSYIKAQKNNYHSHIELKFDTIS